MAGGAPLHPDLNPLDLHVLVERGAEIIVLVLILVSYEGKTNGESENCQQQATTTAGQAQITRQRMDRLQLEGFYTKI